ncbi:hypothetical protein BG015_009797 [Linnemannia schmuckeri]|uniref:DASH complex subunit DAM1 n=1 Tax=Linnemannia schmuckeri TaxID=64567 RepID=A0A9P5V9I5_9FUNG|nr:hypothetical protein BG015_009797 [Linnemannia schmuckeri]
MPQDTMNRRKSRIGPGLKRSIGVGGGSSSAAQVDIAHTLFSSLRHDHHQQQQQQQQQYDAHPLRRSQHYYSQDTSLDHHHHHYNNNQQAHTALTPMQPISKGLEDPVERLCFAVDQLVEKMAVVADIHAGLANFNESFGSLLYGLKMTAVNVEWTEAPTKRSFERQEQREAEAIILQQQQEELEKIRRQQILEKEREMERQRQEVERQEAERARAAMASLNSGSNQNSIGNNHGSRLKRPGTTTTAAGGTSRIPPRRVQGTSRPNQQGANAGASRAGSGGVRKLAGKLVMKRMAERLPLRYRDEPHRAPIEAIMRSLSENIEGRTLPDLVAVAGVARHRCNEYLGVLIHAKEVIKTSQKGVVFSLNPDRYPSR